MFGLQKAIQVTSGTDDPETLRWLANEYRYPDRPASPPCLPRPYVRANMVASIDGAVTLDGRAGGLADAGDRTLFRVLRSLADVVLVGARTATIEGYRQPSPDDVLAADRVARGQTPAPALALLSRTLTIPADYVPIAADDTVILTCRNADPARREALTRAGATVIDCGDDDVEVADVLDVCAERGWLNVLNEGGPTLLGSWIDADAIDELCVTTSPVLVAGDVSRIAHHDAPEKPHHMRPAVIITDDDGYVYTRWTRPDAQALSGE